MSLTQDEAKVWALLSRSLPRHIAAQRVEARYPAGHPDVVWWMQDVGVSGYIELKDEILEVRPQQRIFLRNAHDYGQSAWVLTRYRGQFLLTCPSKIALDCKFTVEDSLQLARVGDIWPHIFKHHRGVN